ncbi:DNA-binding transcriptional regulator, LysR family [Andreprevotia lacus DSM 23236]|jgi:DNA-binding transcriptional LysR family regulator|uniref:DNA-binding transcriptional regulator, LysR family n=1 Tax=Andreprevotia lacus DSM 23236 TaxID=1121001 RepID=A0A1W1XVC6_9NEIS|nr:LysR family transcriptional regulator [Andreprevotia lacus]SMC27501.1 DNA-binding transcriptional regulator, LysR family [Andreprevotia lacus DSM 23236]
MAKSDLSDIDINLLLVLDQLLRHGSVTAAADAAGVTQSAMSRSLARLRTLFNDPLFVRNGNRMVPTARTEALRGPLKQILGQISAMLAPVDFDPKLALGQFRLAITGHAICSLLPEALIQLQKQAPGLAVEVCGWDADTLLQLGDGGADLAFGVVPSAPPGVFQRLAFRDEFACAVRQHHPLLELGGMTVANYCNWPHAELSMGSDMRSRIDEALNIAGCQRVVGLLTPQFWTALEVVACTDLIITAPAHLLRHYQSQLGFVVLPTPPIALPTLGYTLFWHARHQHDLRHAWIRRTLCEVFRQRMGLDAREGLEELAG